MAEQVMVFVDLAGASEDDTFYLVGKVFSFQDLAGASEDGTFYLVGEVFSFQDLIGADDNINPFEGGGVMVTTYYRMRVFDSGSSPPSGYRTWVTTDPSSAPPAPPPVGSWVDRVILESWQV